MTEQRLFRWKHDVAAIPRRGPVHAWRTPSNHKTAVPHPPGWSQAGVVHFYRDGLSLCRRDEYTFLRVGPLIDEHDDRAYCCPSCKRLRRSEIDSERLTYRRERRTRPRRR